MSLTELDIKENILIKTKDFIKELKTNIFYICKKVGG